jgi:hypothetical protein
MFLPNQAALLAWTSRALLENVLRDPDIDQPERPAVRYGASDHEHIRGLALTTGLAILLLVLALALLATGSGASAHAAVAAPPVLCNSAAQVVPVGEAETTLLREPNRSWRMCSQLHLRRESISPVSCWVSLGVLYDFPKANQFRHVVSYCAVLP